MTTTSMIFAGDNIMNDVGTTISYAAFVGSSLFMLIGKKLVVTSSRRSDENMATNKIQDDMTCATTTLSQQEQQQPIRKIAILGAGIGGLSMALALTKDGVDAPQGGTSSSSSSPIEVSIFEGRPSLEPNVGAGFVLNGGLATLGRIDPASQKAMIEAGNTMEGMEGRSKPWWGTGYYKLFDIPLRKLIRQAGKETEAALLPDDQLMFTFIMRGACQEVLYKQLDDDTKSRVYFNKTLVGIDSNSTRSTAIVSTSKDQNGSGGIMCHFADGSISGPFDLVIGADGIRSAVREYVEKGTISKDPNQRSGYYSGLRISYAVAEEQEDKEEHQNGRRDTVKNRVTTSVDTQAPEIATVNLGDGAFSLTPVFGTGKDRPNAKCVFSVYMDHDYIGPFRFWNKSKPIGANANNTTDQWRKLMLQQLRDYNVPINEPGKIISQATRFFELGVYFHNPFTPWSRRVPDADGAGAGPSRHHHVVLLGDAAHATPPFLGQGANQTLQDSYMLGKLIKEYNQRNNSAKFNGMKSGETSDEDADVDSFGSVLMEYERSRRPVVFTIIYRSLLLGYLNLGGPYGIYSKVRDVIFRSMGIFQSLVISAAMPKV